MLKGNSNSVRDHFGAKIAKFFFTAFDSDGCVKARVTVLSSAMFSLGL